MEVIVHDTVTGMLDVIERPLPQRVGLHLVDAHLAASGLTATASTVLPGADILRNAGI